jgi:hypothetical protein
MTDKLSRRRLLARLVVPGVFSLLTHPQRHTISR